MSMNIRWIKITALLCWGCLVLCSQTMSAQCPPAMSVCNDMTITEGSSVQLWAQGAQVYQWTPASGLSSDTAHNPVASPTQTTTYTVTGYNLHGPNQVVNGDFEAGNTGFTSNYTFMSNSITGYGQYTINTDGQIVWGTGGHIYGYGGSGYFMSVDGATSPNSVVWQQTVSVIPNTHYAFSAQVVSMLNSYQQNAQALLQFCINGTTVGPIFHAPDVLNTWVQYYELWYSGNATSATLTILNQNTNGTGNDFGLDNISFYNLDSCSMESSVTVTVLPDTVTPSTPDNIVPADCSTDAEQQPWDAQVLHSVNDIHCYYVPLVGDIDGDGMVEIVAGKAITNDHYTTQVGIYRGTDLQQIGTINVPQRIYAGYAGPMALVRYPDGDGGMQGAIILLCYDNKLRSYDIHGNLLATSDVNTPCEGVISVADFNSDGWPDLYIGHAVYDAATLKRLCVGPANGNMGRSWRNSNSEQGRCAMSFAANVLGDSKPELICGNTIYNVSIISRTDVSLNSITEVKTIPIPSRIPQDGNVAVADFNLDGQLDVMVIVDGTSSEISDSAYIYAYDPVTENILFVHGHHAKTIGYPLVGDIDGDGYLEFVYIDYKTPVSSSRITAMKYHPQMGLQTKWLATHTDGSGQTTMTLFDFNQDNIMEIVYRDESNLRIINGSGTSHLTGNDTIPFYNLYTKSMSAGTWKEYPVVADVNGDGAAEIVTCGKVNSGLGWVGGQLWVIGGIHHWAPARPVWNQYLYNVTNVNKNLTIPAPPFDNATVFTDPQGVVRRPFNNFLQQATTLDQFGRPFMPLANVSATTDTSTSYNNGEHTFTFQFCNTGGQILSAPFHITYYANSLQGPIIQTATINSPLPAGDCMALTLHLTDNEMNAFPNLTDIVVALNDNGQGVAQSGGQQQECDTTDNYIVFPASPCNIPTDTIHVDICTGETYLDDNFNITAAQTETEGTFYFSRTYPAGLCDSTIVLRLGIHPSYHFHITESILEESGYHNHGLDLSSDELTGLERLDTTMSFLSHYGCDSIVDITLKIALQDLHLYLPNAITANGDGLNDEFFIPEKIQGQVEDFSIHIYNRWGELCFYSNNKSFRWDGSVKGKIPRNVTYQYIIHCTNLMGRPLVFTGSITVL